MVLLPSYLTILFRLQMSKLVAKQVSPVLPQLKRRGVERADVLLDLAVEEALALAHADKCAALFGRACDEVVEVRLAHEKGYGAPYRIAFSMTVPCTRSASGSPHLRLAGTARPTFLYELD